MKRYATILGILLLSRFGFSAGLSYDDTQLCINAYNHLWWVFESTKSEFRGDTASQTTVFETEFPKVLDPNFHFELLSLPVPPDFTTSIDLIVDGIPDLIQTAVGIDNFGELHVANPFSVKETDSSIIHNTKVYSLTTRDVNYTRDPNQENGGCTVYLSQKDVVCTVSNHSLINDRKAILNSIVDNVVTAYTIPAPQCRLWTTPPVTDYLP